MGMFTVFQFSDDIDRDIVSVETHSGDRYLEEQVAASSSTYACSTPSPIERSTTPSPATC